RGHREGERGDACHQHAADHLAPDRAETGERRRHGELLTSRATPRRGAASLSPLVSAAGRETSKRTRLSTTTKWITLAGGCAPSPSVTVRTGLPRALSRS